jgi:transposase
MRQKSGPVKEPAEQVLKDIRRATRRHFSAEDKIRIVLEGLRGEDSIAELGRREGIGGANRRNHLAFCGEPGIRKSD